MIYIYLMQKIIKDFYKIPKKIFKMEFNAQEKLVLIFLLTFYDKGKIYPSKKTISLETGLSLRTIDRTIKSLKEKGFLTYIKGKRNISNRYTIDITKIDPTAYYKKEKTEVQLEDEKLCSDFIKETLENNS